MIIGAHAVITSTGPEVDVAFFRDVLKLPSVNDGGYMIFGLPPAEVSVHASDKGGAQEIFLMCDDVRAFVTEMSRRNVACSPPQDQGWGLLTHVTLPSGGRLAIYEPRHKRPGAGGKKAGKTSKARKK
jgi:hypothetical protein